MHKTTFNFKLSEKIKYSNKGSMVETDKLTLLCPSNKNRLDVLKLQHIVMTCFKDMQSTFKDMNAEQKASDTSNSDIGGDEIIGLMLMSDNLNIEELEETFKSLMFSGICKLDGEVNLTESLYENFSCNDTNSLMGEYISNFLLLSIISQQKKK